MNPITNLILIQKNSQILFLYIFSTRCASGENYEMEFSEDAFMKPPRGVLMPFWRPFLEFGINKSYERS